MGTEWSAFSIPGATETVRVHAGFHRNVRITWSSILGELSCALRGRSLLDRRPPVKRPMEALYLTGHSLGGAMALLFALRLCGDPALREISSKLRAVPRSLLAFLANEKDRASFRYSMGAHGAHHDLAALRPRDRLTEFGDLGP